MSMISSTELDRASRTNTAVLSEQGVSIWLDDLSREQIDSGSLAELIENRNVVGVTTNPTIFAAALANGEAYREQVALLAKTHLSVEEATIELVTTDVARACDIFDGLYAATNGVDGRVSIEVDPRLAHDTTATTEQARELAAKVGQPNVLVKIPAMIEGLAAITEVIGDGISVNVTLIFSLDRYRQVIDAYLSGLEEARAAGINLADIHSVASFFVSRVDLEIDKRLDATSSPKVAELRSKAAVANARLAYQLFEQEFATDRACALLDAGANLQRPLWASTGVKDPNLPATYYVDELVAPHTVNTMPAKTLEAAFHHAQLRGNTIAGTYEDARATLDALAAAGIAYDDVTATLEKEGVAKFIASWEELLSTVATALKSAR